MKLKNHFFGLDFLVPFPFFFLGFLFFIISACCSFKRCEMVSGKSNINIALLSLTLLSNFLAITSGIQLLVKLYLAIDSFF